MKATNVYVYVFLAVVATLEPAGAAGRSTEIRAVEVDVAPPSEPVFTSASWAAAPRVQDFTNVTSRKPGSESTVAVIVYDKRNLYVGFTCKQTSHRISDSTNVQDVIAGVDDYVAVDLDTSGVGDRTYSFEATPNGLKYQSSSESARYFPLWTTIGRRHDSDYSAIMIIPLNILRAESGPNRQWRINFRRHISSTGDDYSWAYDPEVTGYSDPTSWPMFTGLDLSKTATRPPPHAAIYGLASAGGNANEFQNADGNFLVQSPRHVGVDASVPFTNTTALVGTFNPDFSNVERDETTTAPQQYRRSLSEYRPFFVQGSDYISPLPTVTTVTAPDSPFYTPNIGLFNEGLKLEGTQQQSSFGILQVKAPNLNDEAYGYQYATANASFVGSFEGVTANHSGVGDQTTGIGLTRKNVNSGETTYFSYLQERGPLETSPQDADSLMVAEGLNNQHVTGLLGYRSTGAQYAPIDGYTAVNDIRGPFAVLSYFGSGPTGGFVKSYSAAVIGDRYLNTLGIPSVSDSLLSASLVTKNLLTLSALSQVSEQRIYGVPYPLYSNPQDLRFDSSSIGLGYLDATPTPTDFFYSFGPFAIQCADVVSASDACDGNASRLFEPAYVQQVSLSTARRLGAYSISLQYNGVRERSLVTDAFDGQWLRSVSISRGIGLDSSASLQLRSISGTGGFAVPGLNLSAALHIRFKNLNELYVNLGSPAATATLNRLLIKYIINIGSGSGV